VVVANITHWAASVVAGKKMSARARFAIFIGSLGIAFVVHLLCQMWNPKMEWLFVFVTSFTSEHILKYMYLEFGLTVKEWIKNQVDFFKRNKTV
jgi:hypothetical protein